MVAANRRNLMIGAAAVLITLVAVFAGACGGNCDDWRSGYEAGFQAGWRAAYLHIAEGGE